MANLTQHLTVTESISARQSTDSGQAHSRVAVVYLVLFIATRLAADNEIGWIMLLPTLMLTVILTKWSPPVSVTTLLFGSVLYSDMDLTIGGPVPRIPAISTITIWMIVWLVVWQVKDGSLKRVTHPLVVRSVVAVFVFFGIGAAGAFLANTLVSGLISFYIFDIFRGWVGFLVLAVLGTRDYHDLKIILLTIPFAFLLYPLSLPADAWQSFFNVGLSSSSVFGVGLSYGTLNTNTLGQAAATSAVIAAAMGYLSSSSRVRWWQFCLFVVCSAIMLTTAARQALVGWLVGLVMIGVVSGRRRDILWLFVLGLLFVIVTPVVLETLPQGTGLQERLAELALPTDEWASQSFTIRADEYGEAFQSWLESPLFGHGFGGQRFWEVLALDGSGLEGTGTATFALAGTHNLVLGILAQTGLVGLLVFALLCWKIIRSFLDSCRQANLPALERRALRVTCLSALAAIFVMQNISGGMGVSSAALVFLLGATLSFTASARPVTSNLIAAKDSGSI